MHKKENRDPNRSVQTTANFIQKKLIANPNVSLHSISSTQPYIPASKQQNKNSQILAQIKQSKNMVNSKYQKQPKQNLSTTRNNYKPKFILKDLMQQKQLESQESESKCEDYFIEHQETNNMSNTFNNSPLASEANYRFNAKQMKGEQNANQGLQNRNKSVVLSKRNYLEDENKKQQDHESTRYYDMPLQSKNPAKVLKRTEESIEDEYNAPQFYEEASTVQYSHTYAKKALLEPSVSLSFEPRIRSVSTSNPGQNTTISTSPKNYKMSYLEAKKQLQIRQAYFSEAMELCRHIIGGMRQVLKEEFHQTESERVMWCHERCHEMMEVFDEWKRQ